MVEFPRVAYDAAGMIDIIKFPFALCVPILVAGLLNVVLRVPGTSVSAFYLLAPLFLVGIWMLSSESRRRAAFFVIFVGYAWVAGALYGTPAKDMAAQTIFYLLALASVEIVLFWKANSKSFDVEFTLFLDACAAVIAVIFAVQMVGGFDLPGTAGYRKDGYGTTFFYTPNDMALFLAAYLIITLFGSKSPALKCSILAGVIVINFINDARAVLMICGVAMVFWLATMFLRSRTPYLAALTCLALALVGCVGLGAALLLGVDDVSTIIEGGRRVIALEPFRLPGSIFNRIDALIFNLSEFFGAWGLGFGPGGTVHVLSMAQYDAITAESLHNAVAELAFDLGPPFYVFLAWVILWKLSSYLLDPQLNQTQTTKLVFLLCLPLLSTSQSSGFISNYGFWIAATFIWTGADEMGEHSWRSRGSALWLQGWLRTPANATAQRLRRRPLKRRRVQP